MEFSVAEGISGEFLKAVQRNLMDLPDYVQGGLLTTGFNFVAGKRMPDLHPGLAEHVGSLGFVAPTIKTIFFAEESFNSKKGEWRLGTNVRQIVFHESGHFIDLFMAGTGVYPGGYASDGAEFAAAFVRDVERLKITNFAAFHRLHADGPPERFERFMREFIDNASAQHETYAEIWGQLKYPDVKTRGMPEMFPDSAAIVRRHDGELQVRYAGKGMKR